MRTPGWAISFIAGVLTGIAGCNAFRLHYSILANIDDGRDKEPKLPHLPSPTHRGVPESDAGLNGDEKWLVHMAFGTHGLELLKTEAGMTLASDLVTQAVRIINKKLGMSIGNPSEVRGMLPFPIDDPVLESATFGVASLSSLVDVTWLLQRFVYDGVLRIPTDYPIGATLGSSFFDKKSTLDVTVSLDTGEQSKQSIPLVDGKFLARELNVGNHKPSPDLPFQQEEFVASVLEPLVKGKVGIEIGGPSNNFRAQNVYEKCLSYDLINFSSKTMWGNIEDGGSHEKGKTYIRDGSTLRGIPDEAYDFALGSHYLEHLLNPLKALEALRRVLKPGGAIILVLPRKEKCFDHKRNRGSAAEMVFRYVNDVSETDMRYAHVDAVGLQSDLSMDKPAKNYDYFRGRSMMNSKNRGIHQFVYDMDSLEHILKFMKFEVRFKGVNGLHQWIVGTKIV